VDAGLDYYEGPIDPAAILRAGYSFCLRYIDNAAYGLSAKDITKAEYVQLTTGGVRVLLVFEHDTLDYTGGFLQGVINARRALAGADLLGYLGPIFMSVDTSPSMTPAQVAVALDYLDGADRVLAPGRLGIYGFIEIIEACQAKRLGSVYWLAGHQPAADAGVHIWQKNTGTVQVGGVECDVNIQLLPFEEDDLTPDQDAKLTAVYQFVTGSAEVIPQGTAWPGWPTWSGGSDQHLTATDYLRQGNVDMTKVKEVLASFSVGEGGDFGQLSDADVDRIAQRVIQLLDAKLSG
jgi:hypothetical protein